MKDFYTNSISIKERCVILGKYLVEHKSTVRAVAVAFDISKSTVHKDVTQILKRTNFELYEKVKEILEINKKERHLRGGEATRIKYINSKNQIKIHTSK